MAFQQADHTGPPSLHKLRIRYKSMRYLATFLYDAGVIDVLDIPVGETKTINQDYNSNSLKYIFFSHRCNK